MYHEYLIKVTYPNDPCHPVNYHGDEPYDVRYIVEGIKKQHPDAQVRVIEYYELELSDILDPQYKPLLERAHESGAITEDEMVWQGKDHVFKETVY